MLLLAVAAAVVVSPPTEYLENVGGWRIYRVEAPGFRGCAMATEMSGGLKVVIRRSAPKADIVDVQLSSPGWRSLEQGASLDIETNFSGRRDIYQAEVSSPGVISIGVPYELVRKAFWSSFGYARFSYAGKEIGGFGAGPGQFAALVAVNKCLPGFADPSGGTP